METLPAPVPVRPAPIETSAVLEQMSDAFYLLDAGWRFRYLNAQACTLFSASRDALHGTRIWDVFPDMHDTIHRTEYCRAMRDRVPVAFDVDDPRFGGWFRIRAYPSPAGLAVYVQDINARRVAHDRMVFQARLLDAVEQAVIVTDDRTIVLYWNQYAETLYGWSAEEATGRPLGDLIVPAHTKAAADAIREQQEQRKPWSGAFELVDKSGVIVPVHVTSSPVFDDDGRCIGSIGISSDIRVQKQAEAALRESEARYRRLVEHLPAVTYTETIRDGSPTFYMSPQIEVLTGYTQEAWGTGADHWLANIHPDDRAHVLAEITRTGATGDPFRVEYRFTCKDGRIIWIRNEATMTHDEPDQVRTWQGIMVDITERKQLEAQLQHAAFHDALTALPNRALFLERTQHALAGTERRAGKIGVLFLDLDNFKSINDTFGHSSGDELLVGVANLLRMQLRKGETLARFGGDEFAILLEDIDAIDDGVRVAQRLLVALQEPIMLGGREIVLEASIGIVISSKRHSTPADLLRDADTALYRAKAAGTHGYAICEVEIHAEVT